MNHERTIYSVTLAEGLVQLRRIKSGAPPNRRYRLYYRPEGQKNFREVRKPASFATLSDYMWQEFLDS